MFGMLICNTIRLQKLKRYKNRYGDVRVIFFGCWYIQSNLKFKPFKMWHESKTHIDKKKCYICTTNGNYV